MEIETELFNLYFNYSQSILLRNSGLNQCCNIILKKKKKNQYSNINLWDLRICMHWISFKIREQENFFQSKYRLYKYVLVSYDSFVLL